MSSNSSMNYIIKRTPYGQMTEVLKDMEKVYQNDIASEQLLKALEQYNQQHLALFGDKTNPQLMIMPKSRVSSGRYMDQQKKLIYKVDHLMLQIASKQSKDTQITQQNTILLKYLSEQLRKYVKLYFKEPFGSQVFIDNNNKIYIGFTGKNLNLANFYTGEWNSEWQVTKTQIIGKIFIHAHFFQAGNVQFQQKQHFTKQFKFEVEASQTVKKIITIINESQRKIQENLAQKYSKMPHSSFKNLRRVVPLTKTKMAWNINAIKMNQNIIQITK